MAATHPHVVIVGAGIAGLTAAVELQRAGATTLVVEASDHAGGRMATRMVDGFVLDEGFQVLNTAYPEVRRLVDLDALELGSFSPGALVRVDGRFHRVGDPVREPGQLMATLRAPVGTLTDKVRIAGLRARLARHRLLVADEAHPGDDETIADRLDRLGFSDQIVDDLLRPLLAGITLDEELTGSARMLDFVMAMLGAGSAALPRTGMAAVPAQLADRLPEGSLRLGAAVTSATAHRVQLADGDAIEADAVILATDASTAAELADPLTDPGWHEVTTWWFAADEPLVDEPVLLLDGGPGPVAHAAVVTQAQPAYAPPGRSLLAASAPGRRPDAATTAAVLDQLAGWSPAARGWDLVATDHIRRALPVTAPPLTPRGPRLADGRYVAGDHIHDPSINGAMRSGRRAATAVAADLALVERPRPGGQPITVGVG